MPVKELQFTLHVYCGHKSRFGWCMHVFQVFLAFFHSVAWIPIRAAKEVEYEQVLLCQLFVKRITFIWCIFLCIQSYRCIRLTTS